MDDATFTNSTKAQGIYFLLVPAGTLHARVLRTATCKSKQFQDERFCVTVANWTRFGGHVGKFHDAKTGKKVASWMQGGKYLQNQEKQTQKQKSKKQLLRSTC